MNVTQTDDSTGYADANQHTRQNCSTDIGQMWDMFVVPQKGGCDLKSETNKTFEYLPDEDIVLVRSFGTYRLQNEMGAVEKATAMLKEHNCHRCIFDHRKAEYTADILDAYDRPQVYDSLNLSRTVRAAIVSNTIDDNLQFYENVCQNRGWDFRIFDDYIAAVSWLCENEEMQNNSMQATPNGAPDG